MDCIAAERELLYWWKCWLVRKRTGARASEEHTFLPPYCLNAYA